MWHILGHVFFFNCRKNNYKYNDNKKIKIIIIIIMIIKTTLLKLLNYYWNINI